jgi:hypothetical protein
MRGFFIDFSSSKEKTQEEQIIYLDLTSPDEPMHPRSEIYILGSFTPGAPPKQGRLA